MPAACKANAQYGAMRMGIVAKLNRFSIAGLQVYRFNCPNDMGSLGVVPAGRHFCGALENLHCEAALIEGKLQLMLQSGPSLELEDHVPVFAIYTTIEWALENGVLGNSLRTL